MSKIPNNSRRSLVILYCAVQAFYWTGYCCIGSYAAVYLHAHNFNNAQLGLVLALGNIGGFFLAPILASIIDKSKKITVFHCLFMMLVLEGILELSLAFFPYNRAFVGIAFCTLMILAVAVNPLNIDMCFALDHSGKYINYGTSRAFGSLAFSGVSVTLGHLCESLSPNILPFVGTVMVVIQLIVLMWIVSIKNKYKNYEAEEEIVILDEALSLVDFLKQNKRFLMFCTGICLLNFSGSLCGNFLINIIENLGGNSSNMGTLSCFTALAEVPIMLLYTRITRNINCSTALKFAAVMYIVKNLFYMYAPSVEILYLSCFIQSLSYALITPAIVDYSSIVVKYSDNAKGQAVSTAMLTLGNVFASQFGGIMLDHISVFGTLGIGAIVCTIGAIICMFSVDGRARREVLES